MADKLGIGSEPRELKIGSSFLNDKTAFHSLRYDFKPASVVSASKHATIEIGANQQVTVTHLETAGAPQTVFKGSQRPYNKECVLILDRNTGEFTLEKLSTNIQLKKTRQEPQKNTSYNTAHGSNTSGNSGRPSTPVDKKPSPSQQSNKKQKSSKKSVAQQNNSSFSGSKNSSPSPSYPHRSPQVIHKSPPQLSNLSPLTGGSLPMIDDINDNSSTNSFDINGSLALPELKPSPDFSGFEDGEGAIEYLSDSSSDGSSSSSSSDSETESPNVQKNRSKMNGHLNGKSSSPERLLNEDLQLSETGSDSD